MSICIYHANCSDGFGAAWVVRKALGDIEFHPGAYSENPPDVSGKNVIIVDFSYPRNILVQMANKAKTILIIDHHKSAIVNLVDLPSNVKSVFDMTHSGVILTWKYFFPEQSPPTLLQHIEDRDLWKFKLPGTRAIMASIFSYPYEFEIWDDLTDTNPSILEQEGVCIERKHLKDVTMLLNSGTRYLRIASYRIPAINIPPTMASDAGHELAFGQPFAACYWDTAKGRQFSLRSNENGIDVSKIAESFGGGGHRNAAGFLVSFDVAKGFEI